MLFLLPIIGIIIALWAQLKVKSSFERWSRVYCTSGMTGREVARKILNLHNLESVQIEQVEGNLTDHYDPSKRIIRLSNDVYDSTSIAAVAVAAHECGHAIQHKEEYGTLMLRHNLVPLLNITSGIAPLLLIAGAFMQFTGLIALGLIFFAGTVLFHLITLPVEFDASRRAKVILTNQGMVSHEDSRGVKNVLSAAAFTYVAAALVAVMELIHYIALFFRSRD